MSRRSENSQRETRNPKSKIQNPITSRFLPLPTARALILVGATVPTAWVLGWKVILPLNVAVFILVSLDYFLIRRMGELQAARSCPDRLFQEIPQQVEIQLTNSGQRYRRVQVRDQTPMEWEAAPVLNGSVPGRSGLGLSYRLVPPERGEFLYGDVWLRISGPLGLTKRQVRVEASQRIRVYPRIQSVRYADLATFRRAARNWGQRPTRLSREGREFESLREYVEGDDIRKIHWKATARLDRPIVQELQTERNQILIVLLDAGRLMGAMSQGMSKLDHALEATTQLAQAAIQGGDQVGVLAFAHDVLTFVPPRRGNNQLQRILEGVMTLQPHVIEPQYEKAILWLKTRVRRRSLVVIFTDLLDEVSSEALLGAVALLRPRHLPMVVAVGETEWDEMLDRPPSGVQDVYERAVLQGIRRQRQKALGHLILKGALALDLPPSKLAAGALQRYLEVKRRGLL